MFKHLDFKAELKAVDDGSSGRAKISGYGNVFNVVDSYEEVVDKGAFVKSISSKLPKMLLQHSWDDVGGIWTLAREDDHGLYLEGELNLDVQKSREYYSLIKQGALNGLSIGFRTIDSYYSEKNIRHLREVDLMEVSIVTFPANEQSLITHVRSNNMTVREFEEFLRDAGFSRTQSKTIVSKGYNKLCENHRDDEESKELQSQLSNLLTTLKGVKNVN